MLRTFFIFLLTILINQSFTVKVFPDDYKLIDNPYENDIESDTEEYHYVLTAVSTRGYTDLYKGIVYRSRLCCYYQSSYCYSSSATLNNYTNLTNINDTNFKELHHYACIPGKGRGANIFFNYPRNTPDSVISVRMRLTNIYDEPFDLNFGANQRVLDSFTIPNNSFVIYTFKLDQTNYYLQKDNFTKPYSHTFSFGSSIQLSFSFNHENKTLYFNSYIVSLDLKKYILSLSGHAHNHCSPYGCLVGTCSSTGSSISDYAYCSYSSSSYYYYGFTECSLWGCIPGSYCDGAGKCNECDDQCKGCNAGPMNCKSCYITSMNNLWKYHHRGGFNGPCPFEFYPFGLIFMILNIYVIKMFNHPFLLLFSKIFSLYQYIKIFKI